MKIAVACDHGGLNLKKALIDYLKRNGYKDDDIKDFGTYTTDSCDYPDFALKAAEAVASGECERGIVVCSSGIGVSIVANKVPGIRCAHCHDVYCAKYTRYHNDANMIAFGERVIGVGMMEEIVSAFLTCEYMGGERHDRRIAKIKAIEEKYCKTNALKKVDRTVPLKTCRELALVRKEKPRQTYLKWAWNTYQISEKTADSYAKVGNYVDEKGNSVFYKKGKEDFNYTQILNMVTVADDVEFLKKLFKQGDVKPSMTSDELRDAVKKALPAPLADIFGTENKQ